MLRVRRPEALFSGVDEANQRCPKPARAAAREIRLYARNELHFDLYLRVKDRLQAGVRARTTNPPHSTNAPRGAMPREAATQMRRSGANPEPQESPRGDRTMLRSPTGTGAASGTRAAQGGATIGAPPGGIGHVSHPAAGWSAGPASGPRTGRENEPAETRTWVIEQQLEQGMVVKERFVLERRLGEGGMGVVFKARDLRKEEARDRDPYVAIKFLNDEFRRRPEALMALQRETRRAQSLAHPNVVTVYDFDRRRSST